MIEPRNIMAISLGSNCVQQPLLSATWTHFGSISNELANETLSRDNKGLVRNRLYCCFSFFISFLHFDPRGLIDSYKLGWIAILGLPCPSALSVVNKSSLLLRSIHILICASLLDKEFYKSQQSPPMLEKSLKREREKKKTIKFQLTWVIWLCWWGWFWDTDVRLEEQEIYGGTCVKIKGTVPEKVGRAFRQPRRLMPLRERRKEATRGKSRTKAQFQERFREPLSHSPSLKEHRVQSWSGSRALTWLAQEWGGFEGMWAPEASVNFAPCSRRPE